MISPCDKEEIGEEGETKNSTTTDTGESSKESRPTFVLAPTPAQLGKAPLQRRQSQGNCLPLSFQTANGTNVSKDDNSENADGQKTEGDEEEEEEIKMEVDEEIVSTNTEQIDQEQITENTTPCSNEVNSEQEVEIPSHEHSFEDKDGLGQNTPGHQKSFFKKNIEDGMDR